MDNISRCTRADVLQSMEQVSRPRLGSCQQFRLQKYQLPVVISFFLMIIIFLILFIPYNICCGYLLEVSTEIQQHHCALRVRFVLVLSILIYSILIVYLNILLLTLIMKVEKGDVKRKRALDTLTNYVFSSFWIYSGIAK